MSALRRPILTGLLLLAAAVVVGALIGLTAPAPEPLIERAPDRAAPQRALEYLATNLGTCSLIVLVAVLAARLDPTRRSRALLTAATDAAITVAVAIAFLEIGEVLGSHGTASLPWLPHLPLETAAVAIACGTYLAARRGQLPTRAVPRVLLTLAGLLVPAAGIEAFLVPLEVL